jgi:hypothetical protein
MDHYFQSVFEILLALQNFMLDNAQSHHDAACSAADSLNFTTFLGLPIDGDVMGETVIDPVPAHPVPSTHRFVNTNL